MNSYEENYRNAQYWTRTPFGNSVYYVLSSGDISSIGVSFREIGVSPCLKITLTDNSIIFNKDKNKLTSSSAIIKNERNYEYTVTSDNIVSTSNKWQTINNGGYFSITNNDSSNKNALYDLKTATFYFDEDNLRFAMYFSHNGSFDFGKCSSRVYFTKTGGQTIDFEGHPHYFKFVSLDSPITIESLKIEYGCCSYVDTIWDNAHGANPTFDLNGSTLTYGLFPQTHVNDSALIEALTNKVNALNIREEEYIWYNDEYYVKDKAIPYKKDYKFSDGTDITWGDFYFFKCEPIKWNIKEKIDNNYTIDCSNIIYSDCFDYAPRGLSNDEYPYNDYYYSHIRNWIINDFYMNAFFLNSSFIQLTPLPDVHVPGDTAWVPSKAQIETWYTSDEARQKKSSDFAMCNANSVENNNGRYWTRSPSEFEEDTHHLFAWSVDQDGEFCDSTGVDDGWNGASPSLTIKI